MRVLLSLIRGDVLELVGLFFEKLVHFLLIFDDPLGDDLPVLDKRALTGLPGRLTYRRGACALAPTDTLRDSRASRVWTPILARTRPTNFW